MELPVAGRWFEKERISDDITLITEPHVVPLMRCNIWHVRGRDRDLMIDTGMGIASLKAFADAFLDKPVTAVATHVHADHIGSHHEFAECLVHEAELEGLLRPSGRCNLIDETFDLGDLATMLLPPLDDYEASGPLITALPHEGYDRTSFRLRPAPGARAVREGDVVDLGDRAFEILHLPGHSPGGIGLWEKATGTLFSGDAIYDGPLIANLPHSDVTDYVRTLERLKTLPVSVVHAGHDPSFGAKRLREIAAEYLRAWSAE
jgi:glyoxylase-like metal-dependent hydrolase (beta-lactamase superfamily II)